MIKSLALEYGKYGVKCNTLSPGFVDTKLTRQNNDEATIKSFANKVPLGKLASVNDIAEIAYFLCSDHNKYINGQNIIADGGYTTGGFQE
jgi:3-oxoacyl-[acyl-carrier protein] reductase